METISLTRLQLLHPKVRDEAIEAYKEAVRITPKGVHPFVTETLRSFARSNALYNQPWDGKDNDGDGRIDEADEKVTNAPGGASFHNYGLAIDLVIQINGKNHWVVDANWMKMINCFKKRGWKWGGDFKKLVDAPHVEKTFGYSYKQLLKLHNEGKVDKDGYVLI